METGIKVGFRKSWGIFLLVAGLLLLTANIYLAVLSGFIRMGNTIASLFLVVSGVLYLNQTYFIVKNGQFRFFSLLGFSVRTYQLDDQTEIVRENGKFYLINDGKRKRLRVAPQFADPKDWARFESFLRTRTPAEELHDH